MSSLKMLAEFDALKKRVEALESDVADLKQKRKPGRPRKDSTMDVMPEAGERIHG